MKTLLCNAHVLTGLPGGQTQGATCLAIEDSRVSHIGKETDEAIQTLSNSDNVKRIDLQGKTVIPSFVDAHVHLLQFGISLAKADLRHCSSLEEIRSVISSTAEERPNATRLLFRGWRHAVTGSNVKASMLDDLDSRPIYIDSDDLHSAWCNTAALDELDLATMPDPDGGKIHRGDDGLPTGLLDEAVVIAIIWPFLSKKLSRDEKLECLRTAMNIYNQAGYTTVIDMAMDEDAWELLHTLHLANERTVRVVAHFIILPTGNDEKNRAQVRRVVELYQQFNMRNSPDLRITGIKIICDGVIDACTAAVSSPYLTTNQLTLPIWDAEALQVVLNEADAAGLQCALHAIGDAAVTMAINGLEALGSIGKRHRIEHLELTKPDDALRLGRLGITASIQPVHCDPELYQIWPALIGDDLCARAFAYGEFHQHGAHLAIGTDAPTAPHGPWNNIFNAVTRRSFRRPHEEDTVNLHFAVELQDALIATSFGGAYSCFAEDSIGGLEVGKQADLVILDCVDDWVSVPSAMLKFDVMSTWLAGQVIWQPPKKD